MSMIWDAPLVSALAGELAGGLVGDRLRAHRFDWDQRELALFFRSGTLRWALHPGKGWVTLDPPTDPPPQARPLSARLVRVSAPPDERILELGLRRSRGQVRDLAIVFELMTNQWNALLLTGDDRRIRHLLWTRNLEERPLVVGRAYEPPPPSNRRGISTPLTPEEWEKLLEGKSPEEARRTLLEEVAFTSPINLSDLLPGGVGGEGLSADHGASGEVEAAEAKRGYSLWTALRNPKSTTPCVLDSGRDKQPYPFVLKGYRHTTFPDLLSAIQAAGQEEAATSLGRENLLDELDRVLRRAQKRVSGIQKEMKNAADPQEPRDRANLILARLNQLPRGAETVTLVGFGGEAVDISLDPSLSPRQNADALYEEAARRERARDRLPPLMAEAREEVRTLEELRGGFMAGEITPQEIEIRLPKGRKKAPGKKQAERLPYRVFRSSGGLEIRVGRGSRDNDALTFRNSAPEDVWLHARDTSGAHVILRWQGEGNPPRRDLEEAAVLAALHSGSRGSATVPVDWTRRKYVRKPRKARPGTVIPQEVQTLFVEPNPDLMERLKEPRPSPS